MLELIADDCAILRKFQGRSSLRTYLTIVIGRLFLDFRISAWGKWRPSAEARRAGPTGVLLEQLLVPDGHGFEEACEIAAMLPLEQKPPPAPLASARAVAPYYG